MDRTITTNLLSVFQQVLLADEKSSATVEKYLRDLKNLLEFTKGEPVTKELVVRYKQMLLERYAPASVNSMLAAVNSFLKWKGWLDCSVKSVKIQHRSFRDRDRELTREEYLRLLQAAKECKKERLWLLQTLCATGIRVSELRFITVESLRRGCAWVNMKGKNRQVLLPAKLCRLLSSYAKKEGIRSGSIFVTRSGNPLDRSNILHEMKALCSRAKVSPQKVFPHNLRHLFACVYYQATKDLGRLADVLGHSNVNTTRIYTGISPAEHIRQLEKLRLLL